MKTSSAPTVLTDDSLPPYPDRVTHLFSLDPETGALYGTSRCGQASAGGRKNLGKGEPSCEGCHEWWLRNGGGR